MEKQTGIRFDQLNKENFLFEKISFGDCVFFNCKFKNVVWKDCHFKQTNFSGNSLLKKCKFINCNFTGQHTNLGEARFFDTDFENCIFKDIGFMGSVFKNSVFSGKATNIVFYGNNAPNGWETYFENVDISGLTLDFVDFRTNFDFSKTIK